VAAGRGHVTEGDSGEQMGSPKVIILLSVVIGVLFAAGGCTSPGVPGGGSPQTEQESSAAPGGLAPGGSVLPDTGLGRAEGVTLQASVDTSRVTVGDPITYILTLTRPAASEAIIPAPDSALGKFEVRKWEQLPEEVLADGRVTDGRECVLSCFEIGEQEIPPLEIGLISVAGETTALRTLPVPIVVQRISPADAEEIKDIKELIYPPRRFPLRQVLIGLLAVGLAAGAVLSFRRRGLFAPQEEGPAPPSLPPHEIAYHDLERIAGLDLVERGLYKAYYTEVSEVIRRYIGGRYGIATMELTTGELLASMRQIEVEREYIVLFGQFLARCDLVKFAKFLPPREEMKAEVHRARELVDATRVVEPGPEPEALEVASSSRSGEVQA